MTREELEKCLGDARQYGGYGLDLPFQRVLAHDAEQRAEIERFWKGVPLGPIVGAHTIINQQREIARLREALARVLECVEDECRIDHHGYCQNHFVTIPCVVKQAQQALKESTS